MSFSVAAHLWNSASKCSLWLSLAFCVSNTAEDERTELPRYVAVVVQSDGPASISKVRNRSSIMDRMPSPLVFLFSITAITLIFIKTAWYLLEKNKTILNK